MIRGLANPNAALPVGRPSAVTIMDELAYTSNFVDTNFVWRGTDKWGLRGLRINGGTTTGRAVRDQCGTMLDGPDVRQHEGVTPSCNPYTRWETNVRGTATYTILPGQAWGDVLVSTVFQRRNGPRAGREPRLHQGPGDVGSRAAPHARRSRARPARRLARSDASRRRAPPLRATSYTVNMLNPGELYGPGYTIFDLKLGKNIRFAGQAPQRRRRYLQPVQQGAGADVPGQLRHR